jgi:hypothetical protein
MKLNFLEANMKTILSVALVLAFCGLAVAQGEKADPGPVVSADSDHRLLSLQPFGLRLGQSTI